MQQNIGKIAFIKPQIFVFFNRRILILSAIYEISARKKFKNYQFAQTNVPKMSLFSTCRN